MKRPDDEELYDKYEKERPGGKIKSKRRPSYHSEEDEPDLTPRRESTEQRDIMLKSHAYSRQAKTLIDLKDWKGLANLACERLVFAREYRQIEDEALAYSDTCRALRELKKYRELEPAARTRLAFAQEHVLIKHEIHAHLDLCHALREQKKYEELEPASHSRLKFAKKNALGMDVAFAYADICYSLRERSLYKELEEIASKRLNFAREKYPDDEPYALAELCIALREQKNWAGLKEKAGDRLRYVQQYPNIKSEVAALTDLLLAERHRDEPVNDKWRRRLEAIQNSNNELRSFIANFIGWLDRPGKPTSDVTAEELNALERLRGVTNNSCPVLIIGSSKLGTSGAPFYPYP